MGTSSSLGEFSVVIGDIGSLLAVLGFGSLLGLVRLYFWEQPLPRARIAALDDLLNDIRSSGDFAGRTADMHQLSILALDLLRKILTGAEQDHGILN
jgi:hypothetical protein